MTLTAKTANLQWCSLTECWTADVRLTNGVVATLLLEPQSTIELTSQTPTSALRDCLIDAANQEGIEVPASVLDAITLQR